jgi:hypothetical protein
MTAPKTGTKRFWKVANKGCETVKMGNPIDGYDLDCAHGYDWECDNCPVVVAAQLAKLDNGGR